MIFPDIAVPCTAQWYGYVPAVAKVRVNDPVSWIADAGPSSNITLCGEHTDPPYPSPVHVSHVHVSVAPTATLSLLGV
jgi:hypothetical protein